MPWTDDLPKAVRDSIREAGRGHLLGDYRSPLDVADEARKRSKEEPPTMNTDKQEALARAAGTFEPTKSEGVTTGVHDGETQGVDTQRVDPADQAQNEGDGEDLEAEGGDDTANDDEEGPEDDDDDL